MVSVAIVGATGLVGRELIKLIDAKALKVDSLRLLASSRSAGEIITCAGRRHTVEETGRAGVFDGIDIVLMSAGSTASQTLAPIAAESGAMVIDNSSAWRQDPDVPLIVPEVNASALDVKPPKGIIANPNCSTIQMLVALQALHEKCGLRRIVVSTYQAASGAGKAAMDELGSQVRSIFNAQEPEIKVFPKRLAFNCIPHIDTFTDGGWSREERKMVDETLKITGLPNLTVVPTCVRVPVFNGHAESVFAEFENPIDVDDAHRLWAGAPGVTLIDDPQHSKYPTQQDVEGEDSVFVGRARSCGERSIAFWCVADNLRKGAATNAVQIAELLVDKWASGPSP